jgi:hypothetical protein
MDIRTFKPGNEKLPYCVLKITAYQVEKRDGDGNLIFPCPFDTQLELVGRFASEADAIAIAGALSSHQIFDYAAIKLDRKENKVFGSYRSKRFNYCPDCGSTYTYPEVVHRTKHGTHRCDCGTLFEIDWDFPFEPTERPVIDRHPTVNRY